MANLQDDIKNALKRHLDETAPFYDEFGPLWYTIAEETLKSNPIPITSSSIVHDNACGNGVVSSVIQRHLTPDTHPTIHATDLSPKMIEETKKRPGFSNVKAEEMDSEHLSFPDDTFTHSFSNLLHPSVLNPDLIAKEVYRTLKPNGVALSVQFGNHAWIPMADAAIHTVRPEAPLFTGPIPEDWKTEKWFRGLFVAAGFAEDSVKIHRTITRIRYADMTDRARGHTVKAISMMMPADWSEGERGALREDLGKRMKEDQDGSDHDVMIVVARK